MTLQQEAYEKIKNLPDNSIRLIIVLAEELARQQEPIPSVSAAEAKSQKRKAYMEMLEMKKKSKYPKNLDYKKIVQEAIYEKYGFSN